MRHHTKDKGDIGVLAVKLDMVKKGFVVMSPETEHSPFDIVAYKNKKFYRIQIKFRSVLKNVIAISSKTNWNDKKGNHIKYYDKDEIDYFAIYCPDNDKCYYIKSKMFNKSITLRLTEIKNKQKHFINFAKNFENI